jgi:hypothetical protein
MSTALALAATSRVIAAVIDDAVAAARLALPGILGSATTTSSPPDRLDTGLDSELTNLNLFLYHVTYNQGWREVGLPTRGTNGSPIGRAPLALDLHYLLSAYSAGDYEAQIMLGIGMQALHETPLLFRQKIQDVFAAPTTDVDKALATSGLADQIELMKITPQQLSTDELAKLWTAFPSKFRVSAGYEVCVALIETQAPFTAALPVLNPKVWVFPFVEPSIQSIAPAVLPFATGASVTIAGSNLPGAGTVVIFDGAPTAPQTPAVIGNGATVSVTLPNLEAGINTLRVVRELDIGEATPTPVAESNVASFILQPVIQKSTTPPYAYEIDVGTLDPTTNTLPVTVEVAPALGANQKVSLLLTQMNVVPPAVALSYMFDALPADISLPGMVIFRTAGVAAGNHYLVRVRVDGADSPLDVDPVTKQFVSPAAAF